MANSFNVQFSDNPTRRTVSLHGRHKIVKDVGLVESLDCLSFRTVGFLLHLFPWASASLPLNALRFANHRMVGFARVLRKGVPGFGIEVIEQLPHELLYVEGRLVVEAVDQGEQRLEDQCLGTETVIVFHRGSSFGENDRTQHASFVLHQTGFDENVSTGKPPF